MGSLPETSPWGAVGDAVALYDHAHYGLSTVTMTRVKKLTATQVVVESHDRRFRRDDGSAWGNRHGGTKLMRPESREVQDAVAAWAVRMMGTPLSKAVRDVRSRDGALRALQQISAMVRETADKLGVNHADLV